MPLPPETPASELADAEGKVRVFYRARDAFGTEYEGSFFIIVGAGDTVATLELESEEFAYAVASSAQGGSGDPDITEVVQTILIPALPIV